MCRVAVICVSGHAVLPGVSSGQAATDFQIQGREAHGIGGLVNLFGIESPGITASLAIAARAVHAALQDWRQ
jgi:L-2-hydroxyglutarate oxidase LhgO